MKIYNKKFHLIGIGGVCINGIARILFKMRCTISGSDIVKNNLINKLNKKIKIFYNHSSKNIFNKKIDYVVYSSAIKKTNIELLTSKKLNIPTLKRDKILNEITKYYDTLICISGTHGKTTTTSILIYILNLYKKNPTFINGGIIKGYNNSHFGSKKYFILESDESDKTFLKLYPNIIVITSIDDDHIRNYKNNINYLKKKFIEFTKNIKNNGFILMCIDNKNIQDIIKHINNKIYTYGFNKNANYKIYKYRQFYNYISFKLKTNLNNINNILAVKIYNCIGKHNALNTSAAIIVMLNLKIIKYDISKINIKFPGVINRMDILGKYNIYINNKKIKNNIIFISDYGHHPFEIYKSIETVKKIDHNKIIVIFQPHRFTRTYDLLKKFIYVLSKVNFLILLNIYSAGEKNIHKISGYKLFYLIKKNIKGKLIFCKNLNLLENILIKNLYNNDIVLIQGAGNLNNYFVKLLSKRDNNEFSYKKI